MLRGRLIGTPAQGDEKQEGRVHHSARGGGLSNGTISYTSYAADAYRLVQTRHLAFAELPAARHRGDAGAAALVCSPEAEEAAQASTRCSPSSSAPAWAPMRKRAGTSPGGILRSSPHHGSDSGLKPTRKPMPMLPPTKEAAGRREESGDRRRGGQGSRCRDQTAAGQYASRGRLVAATTPVGVDDPHFRCFPPRLAAATSGERDACGGQGPDRCRSPTRRRTSTRTFRPHFGEDPANRPSRQQKAAVPILEDISRCSNRASRRLKNSAPAKTPSVMAKPVGAKPAPAKKPTKKAA